MGVHRRIGLLGFGLAVVMVVLGVLAAGDQLTRHLRDPGNDTPADVRLLCGPFERHSDVRHVYLPGLPLSQQSGGTQTAYAVRHLLAA